MTPSPPEAACWLAGTNFSTHRTDILRIVRSILLNLTNKVYWIRITDSTFTVAIDGCAFAPSWLNQLVIQRNSGGL